MKPSRVAPLAGIPHTTGYHYFQQWKKQIRHLEITYNVLGAFDQLADNYAEETRISEYMQQAYPNTRGRIDLYGYYTDTVRRLRVAISPYYKYASRATPLRFIDGVGTADDPYYYISHRGVLPTASSSSQ